LFKTSPCAERIVGVDGSGIRYATAFSIVSSQAAAVPRE